MLPVLCIFIDPFPVSVCFYIIHMVFECRIYGTGGYIYIVARMIT